MDAARQARARFIRVNLLWSVTIVALAALVIGVSIVNLDLGAVWVYALLGLIAGAAIGFVRDRRVFQAVIGSAGLVVLGFALYWTSQSAVVPGEPVLALFGSAGFAFLTVFTLTRVWGRERPLPTVSTEELDDAVARPRMG